MYRNWLKSFICSATPLNSLIGENYKELGYQPTLFTKLRHYSFWLIVLIFLISLNACSLERVKPWQRDLLAAQKMQLDPAPVEYAFDEHIYFSKEASSGGEGVGGGGCGCN